MFELFRSGAKAQKLLLGGLLVMVAVSMITYLIPSSGLNDDPNYSASILAEVGGEKITAAEVQAALDRMVSANQLPRDAAEVYFPQFVDSMVQDRATVSQFAKMGLEATDEEVLSGFMTVYPQLFDKGKLTSTEQLDQILRSNNMTMQSGIDNMRKQVLMKKLQNVAYSTVVVTKQEVDQALIRKHRTAKVDYILFAPGKFRDRVKPTAEDLKKEYESHKDSYKLPEKHSFDIVLADRAKVEQAVTVSDAQIRAAYSQSMDNFRTPERVRARHILIKTQDKPESEKGALLKKAQDLLKQLKAGADFAELAKKNSEDPGSGAKGGDLDFFVRGQMVPEFEKFSFAANVTDISDIVTTQFGYHIIQVTAKEAAKIKPLEEVKDSIAKQLKADVVTEKMQQSIEMARAILLKPGTIAADAAKLTGLETMNFGSLGAGEPVGPLGRSAELDSALGTLQAEGVSDVIIAGADKMVVARLNGRVPSRVAGLDEVTEKVRNAYIANQSLQLSQAASEEAGRKAKAGEDLAAIARSYGLEVGHSKDFTSADTIEGLGPAINLDDAFTMPTGSVVGPTPAQGQTVIYKIIAQQIVNPETFAFERDAALQELKQNKARTMFEMLQDSLLEQARRDGKVKIYQDRVQRVAASYRQR